MRLDLVFILLCCLLCCCLIRGAYADEQPEREETKGFDFALIGDLPYGLGAGIKYAPFEALQSSIERSGVEFVIHVGDIKSGQSPCSDALLRDRLRRFNAFKRPFILTLGDNEWTDCHRRGMDPLERLDFLRQHFYANPTVPLGSSISGAVSKKPSVLAKQLALETQASQSGYEQFVEHQRWQHQGIQFVTLHLVGSRNGLLSFKGRTPAHDDEVKERTAAAIAWLSDTVDQAKRTAARGIVVIMHANPGLNSVDRPSGIKHRLKSPPKISKKGFESVQVALAEAVAAFKRPVVLVHGDTHEHRIDHPPLADRAFPNFTRVEVFGMSHSNWVKASVLAGNEVEEGEVQESDAVFAFEVMASGR